MIAQMLQDPEMQQALAAGVTVAILCGVIGVFVVMRRQSFAGHAVTEVGFTGGAGAPIVGAPPLAGLLAFSLVGGLLMARLGERAREREIATGTVLTVALGLGALFLFIQTRYVSEPASLLFGSIFAVQPQVLVTTVVIGVLCLIVLAFLYRPLVFCTVSPQTAAARGVPVGLVGTAFLVLMAIAVAEAAQLVGVLLTTALLIGPASAATSVARRVETALAMSVGIGVVQMVLSIVLAYVSYTWPPGGKGWPVSFFVGVCALLSFIVAREVGRRRLAC
jgi:zinc/manganese transport system permease protein